MKSWSKSMLPDMYGGKKYLRRCHAIFWVKVMLIFSIFVIFMGFGHFFKCNISSDFFLILSRYIYI